MIEQSRASRIFNGFNMVFLALVASTCVFPILHILAVSLSASSSASAGFVGILPVKFNLESYDYLINKVEFSRAFLMTIQRVVLGTAVNMILVILVAYPLSKESKSFKSRTFYAWFFILPMFLVAGLIPTYITVKETGIMNSVWALILPSAVPAFNVVLLSNFFREIPKELEESVNIDGAGHWTYLFKFVLPLSPAALATIALFTIVFHWNSWFDGLIYMTRPINYPLQSYLQTLIVRNGVITGGTVEEMKQLAIINNQTIKAAQIFVAALPIIAVYPFLQKYFIKGVVLGSIKG
jgi:putative aldouronate transport system permease protein